MLQCRCWPARPRCIALNHRPPPSLPVGRICPACRHDRLPHRNARHNHARPRPPSPHPKPPPPRPIQGRNWHPPCKSRWPCHRPHRHLVLASTGHQRQSGLPISATTAWPWARCRVRAGNAADTCCAPPPAIVAFPCKSGRRPKQPRRPPFRLPQECQRRTPGRAMSTCPSQQPRRLPVRCTKNTARPEQSEQYGVPQPLPAPPRPRAAEAAGPRPSRQHRPHLAPPEHRVRNGRRWRSGICALNIVLKMPLATAMSKPCNGWGAIGANQEAEPSAGKPAEVSVLGLPAITNLRAITRQLS